METLASYTLRSKDIPLVRFSLLAETQSGLGYEKTAYSVHVDRVTQEHRHLLPYALRRELTDRSLLRWINHRKAPKNRQFVDQIMRAIADDDNPLKYVDISHALSLNDALWITNDDAPAKWDDFSLYRHPFDEVLAYVAFTGHSRRVPGVVTSPELTSSGALKKCWSNREDGIYLLKGDDFLQRPDGRSQATMEFYAAQIAEKMGLRHIPYDLEEFHHRDGSREIICACKLFTSEDVGFMNAFDFYRDKGIGVEDTDLGGIAIQTEMAYAYGLADYQDMMVFDAIICNQDRHLGNFGYLVDNDTGKYLRPAPIFDNGFSLLLGAAKANMDDLPGYLGSIRGKYLGFDEQAAIFVQPRHMPAIRSLLNFEFQKHPRHNVTDACLAKMSQMIRLRARRVVGIYQERKQQRELKDSQRAR